MSRFSFVELFTKATEQIRKDSLCNVVVFPKTESLKGDKPIATYEVDSAIKWEELALWIESNPELIAIGARDDLRLITRVLKDVYNELHLEQFDSIQIYRGGVDLLRIVNKTRSPKKQDGLGYSVTAETAGTHLELRCPLDSSLLIQIAKGEKNAIAFPSTQAGPDVWGLLTAQNSQCWSLGLN